MYKRPLSLEGFKNWLSEQKDLNEFFSIGRGIDDPNEKYIGCNVRSKVSEQKLFERVETEDDPDIVIREFLEEGGTILAIENKMIQIEVESGILSVPRFCVKICKADGSEES